MSGFNQVENEEGVRERSAERPLVRSTDEPWGTSGPFLAIDELRLAVSNWLTRLALCVFETSTWLVRLRHRRWLCERDINVGYASGT